MASRRRSSAGEGSSPSMNWRTAPSGRAPENSSTSSPFTNAFTLGMPRTPHCVARDWWSSEFTLARTKRPAYCAASFSSTGPRARQGPHQGAQKSTSTGSSRERSITSRSNLAAVTSMLGLPMSGWRSERYRLSAGRGPALDAAGEARRDPQVGGGREPQQPRLLRFGDRQAAHEAMQRVAVDAAAPAGEFLEAVVGIRHAVAAHHGLDRLRQDFPGLLQFGGHARRVGFELGEPEQAGVAAQQAVAEGHAHVAQDRGIGEVALPARDRQLLREVPQQRVGHSEVALGVLEVYGIDLVGHGGGAHLILLHLLPEVA